MKEKDSFREVHNPRHISGIYNYCDRWCERCAYTLRCANFAIGQKMDSDSQPHDRKKEDLWPRLAAVKEPVDALLAKHADHPGVGLAEKPKFKNLGKIDRHRLGAAAMRYMEFTHRFVDEHQNLLKQGSIPETAAAPWSAVSVAEAFDVIIWDHTIIAVKTERATRRDKFDEEMENNPALANMPSDRDGTAKVVLLSIDRSILAWAVLMTHLPEFQEPALAAMLTLHRMRGAMEREIPKARAFVRAGFDTVRFPAK